MDENIAIKVENLTKTYPIYNSKHDRMKEALSITRRKYHSDFHALNNISFKVEKGETLGIIGQNGSGKSTLLKILTGVLTPTSGSVSVNGKVSALLELGAGFNPEMTGMENIYLNATIMGYSKEEIEKRIPQIIEFADIGDFISQPVKMYSSGMFARLAFAVAINVEPDILIVDEALSVGDIRFQIKCMDHMKKMMESGITVLFVSHDINAVRRFCSNTIWINGGKIEYYDETNMVCDKYMQFLKIGEVDTIMQETAEIIEIPEFKKGANLAEIVDVGVFDEKGNRVNRVRYDEYINVVVTYDVYDDNIVEPVLGVALYSVEDEYLCGLNTLLDKKRIPWKYGRNKYKIEYPIGLRVIGGTYYFTVALFEQTATVPIQYISRIKEIEVSSGYVSEGKFIIPHRWCEVY